MPDSQQTIQPAEKGWCTRYLELIDFMDDASSDISFTRTSLSFLSKEAKEDFYTQLDDLTLAFTGSSEEVQKCLSNRGVIAYRQIEKSLCDKAGISGIELPPALAAYLQDTTRALASSLRNPFIAFLQKKVPAEDCVILLHDALNSQIPLLEQCLYETWAAYALIDSFDPVEFWRCELSERGSLKTEPTDSVRFGYQTPLKEYRLPEAVFRTPSGATYAYKIECCDELLHYGIPGPKLDFTAAGNTAGLLSHRVFLLYQIDDINQAPVLAQRSAGYVQSPAMMVECLDSRDRSFETAVYQACCRALSFAGTVPMNIMVREAIEKPINEELFVGCPHTLCLCDYDQKLLEPIVAPLMRD